MPPLALTGRSLLRLPMSRLYRVEAVKMQFDVDDSTVDILGGTPLTSLQLLVHHNEPRKEFLGKCGTRGRTQEQTYHKNPGTRRENTHSRCPVQMLWRSSFYPPISVNMNEPFSTPPGHPTGRSLRGQAPKGPKGGGPTAARSSEM